LDPNKACGSDGIPTKLLKETSTFISRVLALLFRASLEQEKLPYDWKKKHFLLQFTRKADTLSCQTIDPYLLAVSAVRYLNMQFLLP